MARTELWTNADDRIVDDMIEVLLAADLRDVDLAWAIPAGMPAGLAQMSNWYMHGRASRLCGEAPGGPFEEWIVDLPDRLDAGVAEAEEAIADLVEAATEGTIELPEGRPSKVLAGIFKQHVDALDRVMTNAATAAMGGVAI